MKLFTKSICVAVAALVACGCNRKSEGRLPVINVRDAQLSEDLSSMLVVEDVTVFEEAENGMLIHPDKAFILEDGSIVLKDKGHRILKFAADGSFSGTIGMRGRGPQEYSICRDISLSVDGNELSVMDLGNILTYDAHDGHFIRRMEIPHHNYDEFCPGPDGGYYLFSAGPDTEDYSTLNDHNVLTLISPDGSLVSGCVPRKDYILNVSLFTRTCTGTTFLRPLEGENILYEIDGNDIRPVLSIDFGDLRTPAGYLANNGMMDMPRYIMSKYFKMVLYFHNTADAVCFGCMGPEGKEYHCVADLNGRTCIAWKDVENDPSPTVIMTSDKDCFYALVYNVEAKLSMQESELNPFDRVVMDEVSSRTVPVNGNPILAKVSFRIP